MVDGVGGQGSVNPQQQPAVGDKARVGGGDRDVGQGKGVAGGDNLTIQVKEEPRPGGSSGTFHDIPNDVKPNVDPNMESCLTSIDDSSWDGSYAVLTTNNAMQNILAADTGGMYLADSVDVYGMMLQAMLDHARDENELQLTLGQVGADELRYMINAKQSEADKTKEQALTEGGLKVASGITSAGFGAAGGATAKNVGVSQGLNSAGTGLSGVEEGSGTIATADMQRKVKLENMYGEVYQTAQESTRKDRESHSKSLNTSEDTFGSTLHQQADLYNAQVKGLNGS